MKEKQDYPRKPCEQVWLFSAQIFRDKTSTIIMQNEAVRLMNLEQYFNQLRHLTDFIDTI